MSVSKFESEIKIIQQRQDVVYARFSDLNNLSSLKEHLNDPIVQQKLSETMSAEKIQEMSAYAESLSFTSDALYIKSPVGDVTLRIVEREEPKCIKFASEGAPIQLYVWIQLLPHGDNACKMRITVGAEVNFFMKSMVAKPLQQAANGLAMMLASI